MSKKDPQTRSIDLMKSWALKSGYPLENDVEAVLKGLVGEPGIERDFEFSAKNEEGESAIRSVDFRCTFTFSGKTLPGKWSPGAAASIVFLIDAKYSEDETLWFVPSSAKRPQRFPHLVPVATVKDYGMDVRVFSDSLTKAGDVPQEWAFSSGGRKVKEQSRERNSLADCQIQMVGAVHASIEADARLLGIPDARTSAYSHNASVYVPIVVTNAPMYLLNEGISSANVDSASTETEIAQKTDVVLVSQPNIFHVKEALGRLSQTINNLSNRNLTWVNQDLTAFPVIFSHVGSLKAVVEFLVGQFSVAASGLK